MVIHVGLPASFRKALRYNEKKVERGQAQCIHAGNFILDIDQLTLDDKASRFATLERLRPDHPEPVIHASLNFHPSDKPEKEKMITVARDYLKDIGFDAQPWLLYEHRDIQVPHAHLVVSRVTPEGRVMDSYSGYDQLTARLRKLELDHDLVQSRRRPRDPHLALASARPIKPIYGKELTRDAITATLAHVLPSYNYSNLSELNAVLRQYNLWADNGKPGGTLDAVRGLSYQFLDSEGQGIGKRLAASSIGFNPGLDYLETRFRENTLKPDQLTPLAARVQLANHRAPADWSKFNTDLRSAGVDTVPFTNKQGRVYDIVFIDHSRKLVASVHRLADPQTIQHLHLKEPPGRQYQYDLVRDMRRVQKQQLPPHDDQHILTQNLRKVKQQTI